jgi:uncharacterized protein (TIGR03083 family)
MTSRPSATCWPTHYRPSGRTPKLHAAIGRHSTLPHTSLQENALRGCPPSASGCSPHGGVQFHPKPQLVNTAIGREQQHGYSAVIGRLRRRCPRLLLAPAVAASTLFEVWMHHDDLTTANGLAHGTPDHLAEAIPPLMRYQAKRLPKAQLIVRTPDNHEWRFGSHDAPTAVISGPATELVRWLAGRRSPVSLHIDADDVIADQLRTFVGRIV